MGDSGYEVLDFHAHFVVPGARGRMPTGNPEELTYAQRQYAWMLEAWDFPPPEEEVPEPARNLERWIREMNNKNVAGIVFVTGPGSAFMGEAQKAYPDRVFAFSHVSPDDPEAAQKLHEDLDVHGLNPFSSIRPRAIQGESAVGRPRA